jgi:hypothetical protein
VRCEVSGRASFRDESRARPAGPPRAGASCWLHGPWLALCFASLCANFTLRAMHVRCKRGKCEEASSSTRFHATSARRTTPGTPPPDETQLSPFRSLSLSASLGSPVLIYLFSFASPFLFASAAEGEMLAAEHCSIRHSQPQRQERMEYRYYISQQWFHLHHQ